MKVFLKAYDFLISGLALIAVGLLALIFVAIIYDVAVRTLGFQPPHWTTGITEYSLLFLTILAAPRLVQLKAHVVMRLMLRAIRVTLFSILSGY